MGQILAINPYKRNTSKKKGVSKMAKKKGSKKGKGKRTAALKTRARTAVAGLNVRGVVKDMVPTQLGMFSAKWAAKRFGPDASETDPDSWDWHTYLKGALGSAAAGVLLNMIKPGWGTKAMAGGWNLMIFKALENEAIIKSDWAVKQFGAAPRMEEIDELVLQGENGPSMYDEYANLVPADDTYRGVITEPGRLGLGAGGEQIIEPGRLGLGGRMAPAYANAFLRTA